MAQDVIEADMTVEAVMQRWPQTIRIFRHHTEACVGCSLGSFCTVAEAAREYGLTTHDLVSELRRQLDQPDLND